MARGKGRARVKLNQARAGWNKIKGNKAARNAVGRFRSQ